MKKQNHKHPQSLTIRIQRLPITENELRMNFFHILDLLGLDEELAPPRLLKGAGELSCRQKGETNS